MPDADLGEEAVLHIISNLTFIIKQVFPSKCEDKSHHVHLKKKLLISALIVVL